MWPQGRQVPSSLGWKRLHIWAQATLWEAAWGQMPVWDRGTESQRLLSCKVVIHRPPVTRHALLDGASAGAPHPRLSVSVCRLIRQVQGRAEPCSGLSSARTRGARLAGLPLLTRAMWAPSVPSSELPAISAPIGGPLTTDLPAWPPLGGRPGHLGSPRPMLKVGWGDGARTRPGLQGPPGTGA